MYKNILFQVGTLTACAALASSQSISGGLSSDFTSWLNANGYASYNFPRTDLQGGAYGGKESASEAITHQPVIFIHGNSDIAVGTTYWQTGWTTSIDYFLSKGYTKGELYATTWGDGDSDNANKQVHSKVYLQNVRAFIEAVIAYTGAEKVDIISHSMGVTLGRRAIKGGHVSSDNFDLGSSLAGKVDAFVGIAGANWGLTACYLDPLPGTCSKSNGFYPGYAIGPLGLSDFLSELNKDTTKEGTYVASILSTFDDLILYGDLVWGKYTSQIPKEDYCKIYSTPEYTHIHLRDETAALQYTLVTSHSAKSAEEEEVEAIIQ